MTGPDIQNSNPDPDTQRVIEAILAFDGKTLTELRAALAADLSAAQLAEAVARAGSPTASCQVAATWLIKSWLQAGGRLSPRLTDSLLRKLDQIGPWEARLHLLQSLRYLSIPPARLAQTRAFIAAGRDHGKTFVRVWALDALVHLSDDFPELRPTAQAATDEALHAAAASLRARARQLWAERWG